jgi:biotin carboxylase
MKFYILDERQVWWAPAIETAKKYGYEGVRITSGLEVKEPGIGFIRPHADPKRLMQNRDDFAFMSAKLKMIQDLTQVETYEDKSAQFMRWKEWMPDTWRFESEDQAMEFAKTAKFPIVSKADVGASSVNVRIIRDRKSLIDHIKQCFGPGIMVNHCAGGAKSKQRGYVLLQRFIPHNITWRVNAIGYSRAIFKRFCYPDKPVAQTGNVEPVMDLDDETESLLEFADSFFAHANTRWCALDILKDGDSWRLLETSLAWPWPSPGACNGAPIFGSKDKRWIQLWDVMFDELEAGAWG